MTARYNERIDGIDQHIRDLCHEINSQYHDIHLTLMTLYDPTSSDDDGYAHIIKESMNRHIKDGDDKTPWILYDAHTFRIKIIHIPQYNELKEIVETLNRINIMAGHKEDVLEMPQAIFKWQLNNLGSIDDQFAPRVREAADHFFKTKDQTLLDQVIIEAFLYYMKLDREPLTKSANKS